MSCRRELILKMTYYLQNFQQILNMKRNIETLVVLHLARLDFVRRNAHMYQHRDNNHINTKLRCMRMKANSINALDYTAANSE